MSGSDTERKLERLRIEFGTDWIYPEGDFGRHRELRAEKISFYAAAIFRLIGMSCEDYVPLSSNEINPSFAHEHFLIIREAAELGRHLVENQT